MKLRPYEHKHQRPLTRRQFAVRMLRHGWVAAMLVAASLMLGTAGYMVFAHQSLLDAFLNASMLLGGMGPVGSLEGTAGKLFAALFALYSGLVFLVVAGLMLAPVFHRVLHYFHWEESGGKSA
ncbi:MAG: hypothetical protein ABIY52_12085 [Gemmatimonadaceae bacterium]